MGRSINRFNELRQTNARCTAHCTMWGGTTRSSRLRKGEALTDGETPRRARPLSLSLSLYSLYSRSLSHARAHALTASPRVSLQDVHVISDIAPFFLKTCDQWVTTILIVKKKTKQKKRLSSVRPRPKVWIWSLHRYLLRFPKQQQQQNNNN